MERGRISELSIWINTEPETCMKPLVANKVSKLDVQANDKSPTLLQPFDIDVFVQWDVIPSSPL